MQRLNFYISVIWDCFSYYAIGKPAFLLFSKNRSLYSIGLCVQLFLRVSLMWKFISRSLTTTRLVRSVIFLLRRTILIKHKINRATTMVKEAPQPTIILYVQNQRLSSVLWIMVNGLIRHLRDGRFSHCFLYNIGDGLTWPTGWLIWSHPIR